MPRDLPVGNGNLLINHDHNGFLRCIYYPYVGQENHALDHTSHFGLRVNNEFFWLDHEQIQKNLHYVQDSLIAELVFHHERIDLTVTIHDGVDHHDNVFIRKIMVSNHSSSPMHVQLFFHLDMNLYGSEMANTVLYHPGLQSLLFYKGHRYVSVSCQKYGESGSSPNGYACGQKGIHGLEGTWRDAEDGTLQANPIAQGSVDGVMQLNLDIPSGEQRIGHFWVCFAQSLSEIEQLESIVRKTEPQVMLDRTQIYWTRWLSRDKHDLSLLPKDLADAYKISLLVVRSNMDNRGAIIAANDSSMLKNAEDTYSYMWPRDGALIAFALDRAGYHDSTQQFFAFCKKAITPDGYLMHKYNPDGSVGASWLPWVDQHGAPQLPIQEDEVALVVYSLWNHHELADTLDESFDDYENFIRPAAEFMLQFRDENGLPNPSYDLWEERYGIFAFTVATVFAALQAAAKFATYHGEPSRAQQYEEAAKTMRQSVSKYFYDVNKGHFVRALYLSSQSTDTFYIQDNAADASLYALFDFSLFDAQDPRMVQTMTYLRESLWVHTDIGGMARYEGDQYYREFGDDKNIPGNPWFICTLWYAQWLLQCAKSPNDLKEAEELIRWAVSHALPSGIMAEQIHPLTGEPLSVSPLTWSHATLVKVIQDYLTASQRMSSI